MKKINILFILNSLTFGGAEKQVIFLINNLNTNKFVLSLACLKNEDLLFDQIDKSQLQSIFNCNVSKKIDWNAIKILTSYIDKNNIDLIVCTNQYPMLYGLLASRKSTRPCRIVEVFHTTILPDFKGKLQWLIYRHLFKLCDHVVFVSERQMEYWLKTINLKVRASRVIHNGIDTAYFASYSDKKIKSTISERYGLATADIVIGICAVFRKEKKHGDLIEALAKVRQKGVNAKLLIIGDGPKKQKIGQKIRDCGVDNDVVMIGFQDDVRPYVSICDCMAIVSHSVETLSIAALEAMAMGKPLTMSDIGGASEQVVHGENGYLFERGNIDALANCIMQLSDRKRREEMGAASLNAVTKKFTLEKMVGNYEDLFLTLSLSAGE